LGELDFDAKRLEHLRPICIEQLPAYASFLLFVGNHPAGCVLGAILVRSGNRQVSEVFFGFSPTTRQVPVALDRDLLHWQSVDHQTGRPNELDAALRISPAGPIQRALEELDIDLVNGHAGRVAQPQFKLHDWPTTYPAQDCHLTEVLLGAPPASGEVPVASGDVPLGFPIPAAYVHIRRSRLSLIANFSKTRPVCRSEEELTALEQYLSTPVRTVARRSFHAAEEEGLPVAPDVWKTPTAT